MTEKLFPIQTERGAEPHPLSIPWSIAERAYSVYAGKYGKSQSLEELAHRGGFGPGEMDLFLPGWREKCSAIRQERVEIESMLGDIVVRIGSGARPEWIKEQIEMVIRQLHSWSNI